MQWVSSTAPIDTPCNAKGKKDIRVQWRVQWGSWCHTSRSEMDWVILPEGQFLGQLELAFGPMPQAVLKSVGLGQLKMVFTEDQGKL